MTVQPNGGRGGWIIADLQEFDVILWKSLLRFLPKCPGICLSCSHNSCRSWCWHPIKFLLLADALSISNEIGPSSWMAIAIFKAAPKQIFVLEFGMRLRIMRLMRFECIRICAYVFQIHINLIMIFAGYANIRIQGVPKNALSECCWNHSALAQAQVNGTPCVWKLIFSSSLTKTKQDQVFPIHVHGKI